MIEALLSAPAIPAAVAGIVRGEIARRLPGLESASPRELAPPDIIKARPIPHLRLFEGEIPADRRMWFGGYGASSGRQRERVALARLSYKYGPILIAATTRDQRPMMAHDGRVYVVNRHWRAEREAEKRLNDLGFVRVAAIRYDWSSMEHGHDLMLEDDSGATRWIEVLDRDLPALSAEGWDVEIDAGFPYRIARFSGEIFADVGGGSGIDWFELDLGTAVDGQRVDLVAPILDMIGALGPDADLGRFSDDSTVSLKLQDGRILPLPFRTIRTIVASLLDLFRAGVIDTKSRLVRFSLFDAGEVAALEEATAANGLVWRGSERLRELGRRLRNTGGIPRAQVPADFCATLRPYQTQGVDWLQFLRAADLGGILADDMGLGKTVQTLAHLAIEKADGRLDRPSLVVCPTSLVANWKMEAARFAPALSVLALHGPERKQRFGDIADHDLVITTYPLLARDHETLSARSWHLVVLDEAQVIKNPDAITARLATRLEARQRLCLSGTPLENHLGELWSLFAFLAPGFLGDRESFRRRFRTPIEKRGDVERRALLARRVRPFILRRTKEEVVADLPPKTDIVERVEMEAAQRAVYDAIRLAMHSKVRQAIAEKGLARSSIIILDALLKLRQACCDPRLLRFSPGAAKAGSAKFDRLMEMIPELLAEKRRLLVFSQFTSMLALIEQTLDERGISRVVLTGDTRDRETPIRLFQSGEVPLFLVSLKAGGTGLNLTAADTVILYDPWWNPAVEDQASGRAHRIGQDKAVFVHRLVMLGTVEEKMEELKTRKRELVAGILDAERGATLALTEDDIEALFAPPPM
jgi:superfamily II DNA or RNA helicase